MARPVTPCHRAGAYADVPSAWTDASGEASAGPSVPGSPWAPNPSVLTNPASLGPGSGGGQGIANIFISGTATGRAAQGTGADAAAAQSALSGAVSAKNIPGGFAYFDANGQLVGFSTTAQDGSVVYADANGNILTFARYMPGGMTWFDPQGNVYQVDLSAAPAGLQQDLLRGPSPAGAALAQLRAATPDVGPAEPEVPAAVQARMPPGPVPDDVGSIRSSPEDRGDSLAGDERTANVVEVPRGWWTTTSNQPTKPNEGFGLPPERRRSDAGGPRRAARADRAASGLLERHAAASVARPLVRDGHARGAGGRAGPDVGRRDGRGRRDRFRGAPGDPRRARPAGALPGAARGGRASPDGAVRVRGARRASAGERPRQRHGPAPGSSRRERGPHGRAVARQGIDGRFTIRINPDILTSDQEIVGTLAHETFEIEALEDAFRESGGRLTLDLLAKLITEPNGTFHQAANAYEIDVVQSFFGSGED